MSKNIEYRVRAITRYVVTRHDGEHTSSSGEFDTAAKADTVSTALAAQEAGWEASSEAPRKVFAEPYVGPLPGKVMRCKVVLHTRMPQWSANLDADGRYLGRTVDSSTSGYQSPDPTDPANVKADGERLMFGAVCGAFDAEGNNSVEENRIFGRWSPSFMIDGHVRNEHVLGQLEQGAAYYVDFTPAPKR